MNISKDEVLDLLSNPKTLTQGLVEVLSPSARDFMMSDSFRENHVEYLEHIQDAIRNNYCVRIYRPELVYPKFKEYQTNLDALATKITIQPKGFNYKRDYCPWFNHEEILITGKKEIQVNGVMHTLSAGERIQVNAFDGDLAPHSKALENTITFSYYKFRLIHPLGPYYNIDMTGHPFFTQDI